MEIWKHIILQMIGIEKWGNWQTPSNAGLWRAPKISNMLFRLYHLWLEIYLLGPTYIYSLSGSKEHAGAGMRCLKPWRRSCKMLQTGAMLVLPSIPKHHFEIMPNFCAVLTLTEFSLIGYLVCANVIPGRYLKMDIWNVSISSEERIFLFRCLQLSLFLNSMFLFFFSWC